MSFGDTFWKVWEVRTSIKIQESIEGYFNRKPEFDNTTEIVRAIVNNHQSWNRKIHDSREKTNVSAKTILCEFCGNRFNLYSIKGTENQFAGLIFYDNTAYRTNEDSVVKVTHRLQNDSAFLPLFYCSKKCVLNDRSIVVTDFQ